MKNIILSTAFIVLIVPLLFSQQSNLTSVNDSSGKTKVVNQSSTKENLIKKIRFDKAYPNPATTNIQIEYSIPVETTSAKIIIRNLVGDVVIETPLKELQGKANISVADLESGVYFYSLLLNESTLTTRKLIINK